jgi:SAM-dependent methyltransferase
MTHGRQGKRFLNAGATAASERPFAALTCPPPGVTKSSIETGPSYDRIAPRYRERFARELEDKPFDRQFLDTFASLQGSTGWLLDLGSGPGQIGAYLAAQGARVICVDVSQAMLREAAVVVPHAGRAQADMRALPFAESSIDGIVAFYSLIHIPPDELAGTLGELGRVLPSGGHLALTTHATLPPDRGTVMSDGTHPSLHVEDMLATPVDLDFYFYSVEQLAPSLEGAGFELLECAERDPYDPDVETQTTRAYVLARKAVPGV